MSVSQPVCMYVCMYIFIYTYYIHNVYIHAHTHTCYTYFYMSRYIYIYTYVCPCKQTCLCPRRNILQLTHRLRYNSEDCAESYAVAEYHKSMLGFCQMLAAGFRQAVPPDPEIITYIDTHMSIYIHRYYVWGYMYVCMYVCMNVCTYVRMHLRNVCCVRT